MLAAVNTSATTLTDNQIIPVGAVALRTNTDARMNSGTVEIQRPGVYEVLGNFSIAATATGPVTVQMQANGTDVPGATATVTATAAETVSLPVQGYVRATPAATGSTIPITWVVNAAGTLVNAVTSVKRVI